MGQGGGEGERHQDLTLLNKLVGREKQNIGFYKNSTLNLFSSRSKVQDTREDT